MSVLDSLKRARARVASHAELGRLLDLSGEEVGRVLNGGRGISAEVAIRLALANDEDPLVILEQAGHQRLAELLRQIYEPAAGRRLTVKQGQMLRDLEALDREDRQHVLALVRSLAGRRDPKR